MKDLEFHVGQEGYSKSDSIFKTFGEACKSAIARSVSSGNAMIIDVVTWSRAAAKAWGGDAALQVYDEDPEASVHERIIIKAESQGRIA